MALTAKEKEFNNLALKEHFISAELLEQYREDLEAEGHGGLLPYCLDKYHFVRAVCPFCGESGVFKWFFFGKLKHPSCRNSWYVGPADYIKMQFREAFQFGVGYARDAKKSHDKEQFKGLTDQIVGTILNLLFGIAGMIFIGLLRLGFGLLMLPIQALVFHYSQKQFLPKQPDENRSHEKLVEPFPHEITDDKHDDMQDLTDLTSCESTPNVPSFIRENALPKWESMDERVSLYLQTIGKGDKATEILQQTHENEREELLYRSLTIAEQEPVQLDKDITSSQCSQPPFSLSHPIKPRRRMSPWLWMFTIIPIIAAISFGIVQSLRKGSLSETSQQQITESMRLSEKIPEPITGYTQESDSRMTEDIVLMDEFVNNKNYWPEKNQSQGETRIDNGKYYINSKNPDWTIHYLSIPIRINRRKNFQIDALLEKTAGDDSLGYGIIWGGNGKDNCYEFCVYGRGAYSYVKKVDGKRQSVIGELQFVKETNSIIAQRTRGLQTVHVNTHNSSNLLSIQRIGKQLHFYINGYHVNQTVYEDFKEKVFGIAVGGDSNIEVEYFRVKYLNDDIVPIKSDNAQASVPSSDKTTHDTPLQVTATRDSLHGTVITEKDPLRIRRGPGTQYKIIGKVDKGENVLVLDHTQDWYEIKLNDGLIGYVYGEYIKIFSNNENTTSTKAIEQASLENFGQFQSIFKEIQLNANDLPEFEILKLPWNNWGQKGLIKGVAMDVLMNYDKSWVADPMNENLFYALGRFPLNGYEAFLVWGPWAWPVKMYIIDPQTYALVSSEIVAYGHQDRGWQLSVETKFIDLNDDGKLDLLIRGTGESFEEGAINGCWEESLRAKLWKKDRFVESRLSNLPILKEKYFNKKCRSK